MFIKGSFRHGNTIKTTIRKPRTRSNNQKNRGNTDRLETDTRRNVVKDGKKSGNKFATKDSEKQKCQL
jgi:hypothetical protein